MCGGTADARQGRKEPMDGFLLCLQEAGHGGARDVQGRRLIPSWAAKRTPFPYAKGDAFEVM